MQQTTFCALAIWLALSAASALATRCEDPRGFQAWLESFKQEAMAQGISQGTIDSALSGINYDPNIISRDHRQGIFQQSFEQFANRMVLLLSVPYRIANTDSNSRSLTP
jgi:membrane-bound lytic murein transglycosylase B